MCGVAIVRPVGRQWPPVVVLGDGERVGFSAAWHVLWTEFFNVPFSLGKWSLISANKSMYLDHSMNSWSRQAQEKLLKSLHDRL